VDLGAGTGMYSFGMNWLGADSVYSLEIDPEARKTMEESIEDAQVNGVNVMHWDAYDKSESALEKILNDDKEMKIDYVITNPPFGASKNGGIDVMFIKFADKILNGKGTIFSIHKSSTRNY